jgi:Uma2 family endonuclease
MSAEARMTVDEYIEFEKRSEFRHEYVNGKLRKMLDEKIRHNIIVGNIVIALGSIAETRGCDVLALNIKLRTGPTNFLYPNVILTCESSTDEYLVFEPCALFEVQSEHPSDVSTKLEEYLKLPSLQRYVMLRQNEPSAIVYKRGPDGWQVEFLEADGEISIPCLETTLKLEQVYAGLS